MSSGISMNFLYNPVLIERYYYSLPLKRRILARFFEGYRINKAEYDEWVLEEIKV